MFSLIDGLYIKVINKCVEYSPLMSFPIITIISIPLISSMIVLYTTIFVTSLIISPFLLWILGHGLSDTQKNIGHESGLDSLIRWLQHDIEWIFTPSTD